MNSCSYEFMNLCSSEFMFVYFETIFFSPNFLRFLCFDYSSLLVHIYTPSEFHSLFVVNVYYITMSLMALQAAREMFELQEEENHGRNSIAKMIKHFKWFCQRVHNIHEQFCKDS